MPTIALKVQQDGYWRGWSALVGASFAYQAVDDSDGTTHDSADSYITLPKLNLPTGAGRVSFPLFLQAEGLIPVAITLNVGARRGGASHPQLQIGFSRGGIVGFDATKFNPGAGWSVASRTFSLNPITAAAWSESDLVALESCVQNEDGVNGNNDVTLVSGSIEYTGSHNWRGVRPRAVQVG